MTAANPVGIMQGRLSPPDARRLQAFPWRTWEGEFAHAATLGFDCIEWLFEAERFEENPIWTDGGVARIRALAEEHGVAVRSVCADYFMAHPFFRVSETERGRSVDVLRRLVERAAAVGVRVVLVPVLEISEIRTSDEEETLAAALEECLPAARACGVRLGLETELEAPAYAALVERFGGASVGVYYDIGNAAACGYDQERDLERLGLLVCGIHVKDRLLGGASVPLGWGAADIPGTLAALVRAGYDGSLVLQTAFGEDYLGFAATHLAYVRKAIAAACDGAVEGSRSRS